MSKRQRAAVALLCFVCLFGASVELSKTGIYGWTIFIVLPLCAGGLTTWAARPGSDLRALAGGAMTGALGSCLFLVLGMEGVICVAMAVIPLALLSALGSWVVYRCFHPGDDRTAALALLLPISLWFDTHARPPVYSVRTSIVVNAAPEHVWKYAVAFPEITPTRDWVLRTGVAYPRRTRIIRAGVGAARYCDLSTGPVVERVTVWDEPRLLRFQVLATPPSMQESGLYGPIDSKHLNGYFVSKEGQFKLSALPDGRTLLEGTSWYQHGLWPAEYWRWWSDAIVHHIHARVMEHIRVLAEREQATPRSNS